MLIYGATFIVAYLLQIETSRRAIEQTEQPKMIVFRSGSRQLDHRRGAVEHLPAAIQHEVIVRRHLAEGDRQGRRILIPRDVPILKPSIAALILSLLKPESFTQPRFP